MSAAHHRAPRTSPTPGSPDAPSRRSRPAVLPFQRLSEAERLERDLAALVEAGLIASIDNGAETRFEVIDPRTD